MIRPEDGITVLLRPAALQYLISSTTVLGCGFVLGSTVLPTKVADGQ
jgi:hypothetical protein